MNSDARPTIIPKDRPTSAATRWIDAAARRAVLHRFKSLKNGRIELRDGDERFVFGAETPDCPLHAKVEVLDREFYGDVGLKGALGAGESYIQGGWECDDLTALIRILALNDEVVEGLDRGWAALAQPVFRVLEWMRRNTRRGSARNIAAHYDLGNDFFRLMLDETMMYSCGIFERPDSTLKEASVAKLDRICRKLALSPSHHVVEIGTGWGGFAIHAAGRYGCRITTTTISEEQWELATQRVAEAGLADRVTIVRKDYRDLVGAFDRLVSIEMIEAVGHEFLPEYFAACSRLLKPDGAMLIQAITMADRSYENARRTVDFIKKYVFPGSCIPSFGAMISAVARRTDLQLLHVEDIGPHYAPTLRNWWENVERNREAIRSLGYSEAFLRLWRFYLCYCEGGFLERLIGDAHLVFAKPMFRGEIA